MVLREKRKLDHKNRLHIPMEYIEGVGGRENGEVYVQFDERTRRIENFFPRGGVPDEAKETPDSRKLT